MNEKEPQNDTADPSKPRCYGGPVNQAVIDLVPGSGGLLLDVGCGSGVLAKVLAARGFDVDGVTISEAEAEEARHHCRRVDVWNVEQGLPASIAGETYDVVLMSHVLEHLRFNDQLLAQVRLQLRPATGRLVVALPNMLFYKNRIRLLLGSVDYEAAGLMDSTHYRWYTFASAAHLLESSGFTIERQFAEGSAPLWVFRRLLPASILGSFDATAVRMAPGLFGYQLLYLCAPGRS